MQAEPVPYTEEEIQAASMEENVAALAAQVDLWRNRAIALNIEVQRARKAAAEQA